MQLFLIKKLKFAVPSSQEWQHMWSSAAVAHLHQGFRHADFSYLGIISNQTAHAALMPTKHFSPDKCCTLDIDTFFGPFSVNLKDYCV